MPANKNRQGLGQAGETRASEYLKSLGWEILDRNVEYPVGELDLVCYDPKYDETVFVEVKTRTYDYFGYPADAVDNRKLKAFVSAGGRYCSEHHVTTDFRYDIISITPTDIEHYENVTFP